MSESNISNISLTSPFIFANSVDGMVAVTLTASTSLGLRDLEEAFIMRSSFIARMAFLVPISRRTSAIAARRFIISTLVA